MDPNIEYGSVFWHIIKDFGVPKIDPNPVCQKVIEKIKETGYKPTISSTRFRQTAKKTESMLHTDQ